MTIQWFPGHMAKARRQIQEKLKLIDVVLELLDARIPLSSRNPMIDEIVLDKPRLVLLNKADLADRAITTAWMDTYKKDGLFAMAIDASSGSGVQEIVTRSQQLMADKHEKHRSKGIKPRAIRALIVGIPNVGKSTLINRLAGRNVTATGDRPGVTKGQQWIKVGTEMELLDTPGVLWPKFEDEQVGINLAATGAIKDELLHVEDIAYHMVRYMLEHYSDRINERFELELDLDLNMDLSADDVVAVMEQIGKRRGCVMSGGRIDLEKTSNLILRDMRSGKLGRMSLEKPNDA